MGMITARPSKNLAPYVKFFWSVESCTPLSYRFRVVPSGLPELMILSGALPGSTDPRKCFDDHSLLCGQQAGPYEILISEKLSLFSIVFNPVALFRIFHIPAAEFFNRNIPLNLVLKHETDELETEISAAGAFDRKLQIAERFVLDRLKKVRDEHALPRMQKAVEIINHSGGSVSVNTMASAACLSRKQFERRFSEFIGSTPGQFLKIIRFQQALHQKNRNPHISLAALALDCGYFDQSHMSNDFKQLTGLTPRSYFAQCEPFSDYFSF